MPQEPVAEPAQGARDAVAQVFPDALAGFVRLGPPGLDDAARGLVVGGFQAARMGGEPQRGKVRVEFLRENQIQVRFDI